MAACPVDFLFKKRQVPESATRSARRCSALCAFSKDISRRRRAAGRDQDAAVAARPRRGPGRGWRRAAARLAWTNLHARRRGGGDRALRSRDHSAVSYALMMKRLMNETTLIIVKTPWATTGIAADRRGPPAPLRRLRPIGRSAAREKIPIDAAIVHRWSKLLHDASSHDVMLQTDDEAVGAHVSILSLASPVLDRMLSTAMVEGRTKRVAVRDTPKAAMELFLEIVYTGCVSAEEEDDGDATEESDESADTDAAASSRTPPPPPSPPRSARTSSRTGGTRTTSSRSSRTCWPRSSPTTPSASSPRRRTSAARAPSSTRASRTPRARPRCRRRPTPASTRRRCSSSSARRRPASRAGRSGGCSRSDVRGGVGEQPSRT